MGKYFIAFGSKSIEMVEIARHDLHAFQDKLEETIAKFESEIRSPA